MCIVIVWKTCTIVKGFACGVGCMSKCVLGNDLFLHSWDFNSVSITTIHNIKVIDRPSIPNLVFIYFQSQEIW